MSVDFAVIASSLSREDCGANMAFLVVAFAHFSVTLPQFCEGDRLWVIPVDPGIYNCLNFGGGERRSPYCFPRRNAKSAGSSSKQFSLSWI